MKSPDVVEVVIVEVLKVAKQATIKKMEKQLLRIIFSAGPTRKLMINFNSRRYLHMV